MATVPELNEDEMEDDAAEEDDTAVETDGDASEVDDS